MCHGNIVAHTVRRRRILRTAETLKVIIDAESDRRHTSISAAKQLEAGCEVSTAIAESVSAVARKAAGPEVESG